MSIFNQLIKSHDQLLTDHVNSFVYESSVLNENIKSQVQALFNMVWHSDFAPQEIIDQLGDRALPMFIVSAQLQSILKSVDSEYKKLIPPFEYSIKDGKIFVSDIPTEN